jgi:tripartite-type tricarboxylate transporter receptor subunit TctC
MQCNRRSFVASAMAFGASCGGMSARAQTTFPNRPIHLIVPYPGGLTLPIERRS